ncbi:MAG: protein kinase, partial [Chloroflexota bacterium]
NDRYLIQQELGRGGMGVVYRAEDTLLQRPVAVKMVSAGLLGTEGHTRLLGEARAIASLNHPNIVAVYDVGQSAELDDESGEPGLTYIVMELLEGHSLRTVRPSSLDESLAVTSQICQALAAAHDHGIIHRDLKPENVVVAEGGAVKLTDFGLARRVEDKALPDGEPLAGTIAYMAPELILGRPATPQSDLYALGVILYELLAGRPPTEGDDLTALLSHRLYDPLKPPSSHNPQVPPALDVLALRLLNKRPDDRPESAAEAGRLLREFSQNALAAPGPVQLSAVQRLGSGRLIGREREFADLVALWQTAVAGRGQVAVISGEPGIGKTRLSRELIVHAEISGGLALSFSCYEEYNRPYGPFVQLIEEALDRDNLLLTDLPASAQASIIALLPEMAKVGAGEPVAAGPAAGQPAAGEPITGELITGEPGALDSGSRQNQLFDGLAAFFAFLARQKPLLLVMDDLHWLDGGSALLFQHLARRAGRLPLMIAGTYRELELLESRPFSDVLEQLTREHLLTRLKLSRLSFYQTWELLRSLFAADVPMNLATAIFRETEGNPFFVAEVCKSLVESGALVHEDGRWQGPEPDRLAIPQAVQVAIQMRLTHLSEPALQTLQTAALLGRQFRYDMLAAAADLDEDDLIAALEEAERAQLIAEKEAPALSTPVSRPVTFSFSHALLHSTLLADMSTLRRQRRQRQIALALEAALPDRRKALAPMLGRFFAEAGDGDSAVPYLLLAGDAARRVLAYDEAVDAYEAALLFQKEAGDPNDAARTLMNLGFIYHSTFHFERARRAYDEAFALWQDAAAPVAAGEAWRPEPTAEFRYALHAPKTLDPALCADGVSEIYINQLFGGLVELNSRGEILPNVAQSWQVLDGGRRYVFQLRPDVFWSDGYPVIAADFVFAWRRALDPDHGPNPANLLYDVKGAQAYNEGHNPDPESLGLSTPDQHTLVVELEGPTAYFLQLLTRGVAMPVPGHVVRQLGLAWSEPAAIVTNGPYRPASWDEPCEISLLYNPRYHGRFDGNVNRVVFYTDPEVELLASYESGQIDVISLNALEAAEAARARLRFAGQYVSLPYLHTSYFAFDVSVPPFDDRRLRRAIALATDKAALADRVLGGAYVPAIGGLLPPGMPGSLPLGDQLPETNEPAARPLDPGSSEALDLGTQPFGRALFDPDRARELMAGAGYPSGRGFPRLPILVTRRPLMTAVRDFLSASWSEILGIEFEWIELWFADYLQRLEEEKSPIWFSGWAADYPDPDTFMRVCGWRYVSGWHHEQYERLVDQARRVAGENERLAMYRQAEAILAAQNPVVPLFYSRHNLLLQPRINKYPIAPFGTLSIKDFVVRQ